MKTSMILAAVICLGGCASTGAPDTTKRFYAQESEAARMCLRPVEQMQPAARLVVDMRTGSSPMTRSAWCYSNQIRTVVRMMNYPHAALVTDYADYLTRLTAARDRGLIDTQSALDGYRQASILFRQSIGEADDKIEATARRELASRLAVFAQAMGNLAAEQERQRMANRPVSCVLTGIYKTTGVTCR